MVLSTPNAPASRLLSLPAELRNAIYDLVLTTNDHVICLPNQIGDRTVHRFRVSDPSTLEYSEFNQMKFVCRKLYLETSSLVPKSPRLIFPERNDTTECASVTCARFLSAISLTALLGFKQIHINERVPYKARALWSQMFDLDGVASLADFCRANPKIELALHLRSPKITDQEEDLEVFLRMETICLAIRKRYNHVLPRLTSGFDHPRNIHRMAKKWSGYGLNAAEFPENLVLRPTGVFEPRRRRLNARMSEAIMKWFEDGI